MLVIPTSTDPLFSQVTTLAGRDYILTFAWNLRESAWYLDIADQDGVVLAASLKLTVNYPLLARRTDPRLPAGVIYPLDRSGAGIDPGLDDLGTRVVLMFIELSDLASF